MSRFDRMIELQRGQIDKCLLIASRLPEWFVEQAIPSDGHLYINTAYDLDKIEKTIEALKEFGFTVSKDFTATYQPVRWIYFSHEEFGHSIQIAYSANLSGATCKVGVLRERVDPVYEITCLEAEEI